MRGEHHHHGRFGLHGPAHRGRGERLFEQGDLRWVVLKLIAEQPRHGYEIIKEIEDRVGGGYSPSPGVIYPTLTLLEELGCLAAASAEGARKLFNITAEGARQLEVHQVAVEALVEKMRRARERSAGSHPPPIQRATENVLTALRLKLQQGGLDDEQVRTVAEILDTAAVAIERA